MNFIKNWIENFFKALVYSLTGIGIISMFGMSLLFLWDIFNGSCNIYVTVVMYYAFLLFITSAIYTYMMSE
jgi:hypothetical protein